MVYSENIHWYQIVHVSPFSYLGGCHSLMRKLLMREQLRCHVDFPKVLHETTLSLGCSFMGAE